MGGKNSTDFKDAASGLVHESFHVGDYMLSLHESKSIANAQILNANGTVVGYSTGSPYPGLEVRAIFMENIARRELGLPDQRGYDANNVPFDFSNSRNVQAINLLWQSARQQPTQLIKRLKEQ